MANPLTPDFDRNSNPGRLVTDRFDFALHYEGVAFRHDATMIDLKPDLTIGADFCTTVQEALEALLGIIGPSPFTLATIGTTTANLGIVTLGGDFGGTALIPRVTAIQGRAISTLPPSNGNVLIWSSSTGWTPTPFSGVFTAGGDLSGTSTLQTVIGLQGKPVSTLTPSSGNVLTWNVSTGWTPEPNVGVFTAGGDLSGTDTSQTVIGLQGNPVSALAPTSGYVLTWNVSTGWTPEASTGVFTAAGDLSGTDVLQKVIGLQGNAIKAQTLGAGQDQYILTWNNSTSNWQALPNAGGGAGGITTLTGDVLAGPGSGSQAASVVRIRGNPVSATASTAGQYLIENAGATGSAWTTLAGDVSSSTSIPGSVTVIGIRGISVPSPSGTNRVLQYNAGAYTWAAETTTTITGTGLWHNIGGNLQAAALIGTAGQFVVANTTPDAAFVTISGDATASVSVPGQLTNVGLRGITVPAPSGTNTVLQYNSGAYTWATVGGGTFTPGSDLLGNGTSTTTNQYVSSISYSASSAGGSVAVNGTNTLLNWVTNAVTLQQAATTLVQLKATTTDFIRFGAIPGTVGFVRAPTNSVIIGVNGNSVLQTDTGPATYLGGSTQILFQVGGVTEANLTAASLTLTPNNFLFGSTSGATANIKFSTTDGVTSGGGINIQAQSGGSGTNIGGNISIGSGSGSGGGADGTISLETAGLQRVLISDTAISILPSNVNFTATAGAPTNIQFGSPASGVSGATLSILGQQGSSGGGFGGPVSIEAGACSTGSNSGGSASLSGGIGAGTGNGGAVLVTGGNGADVGGAATLSGGNGVFGGDVTISGGFGSDSSGNITLVTGFTNLASFEGGEAFFTSALGGIVWSGCTHSGDGSSLATASINFATGSVSLGSGGTITLTAGQAAWPMITFTGSITGGGGATIIFPNNVGALWFLDFSQVNTNTFSIFLKTSGGTTITVFTNPNAPAGVIAWVAASGRMTYAFTPST